MDSILRENGNYLGTHIGDSWSDVETLDSVPNSIAFNPGCELALRNATISVVGTSLLGLMPLFDNRGEYDSQLSLGDLPQMVILNDGNSGNKSLGALLVESKRVKKQGIGSILDTEIIDSVKIETAIKEELTKLGIEFMTKITSFMPPETFDAYARAAYSDFLRKNG